MKVSELDVARAEAADLKRMQPRTREDHGLMFIPERQTTTQQNETTHIGEHTHDGMLLDDSTSMAHDPSALLNDDCN